VDADVVIVGAGAAGLAAAQCLAGKMRVLVLEARDRVGGRAWSLPTARAATPAELGAEFIHGRAKATTALLRSAGAAAVVADRTGWTRANGALESDRLGYDAVARLFDSVASLTDDESVDAFLRRFERDAATRSAAADARSFVEGFDAADTRRASVRAIAAELDSGVDSTAARPIGGYRPLMERLSEGCTSAGVEFALSKAVRRIVWRRGRITVEAHDAQGRAFQASASAAILTLPVGVLRHRGDETAVAFDPPLPAEKHAALEFLEMGPVVKVELWFRSPFWEEIQNGRYRDGAFFRSGGGPFPVYWTQLPVRSELVAAWAGGPSAAGLRSLCPDALIERAVAGFGALFDSPEAAREALAFGATHDWNADPFTRGAYSYVTTGGAQAREALGRPIDGTLFFAGEATAEHGESGTVNGALESGARAARELAAR
jgi:monoamine oxidase